MNFSEKLIKLRKENGLSQEELGYKLNVTRQTVSKWELGQTTPEMSKLVEMSKLFGVTLDELTDDKESRNEHIESNIMEEDHNRKNKIIVIILIGVLIVLAIFGANKIFNTSSKKGIFEEIFGDIFSSQENVMSQAQNLFEGITQIQQNIFNQVTSESQQNLVDESTTGRQEDLFEQATQAQQNLINQAQQNQQDLINQTIQGQQELMNQMNILY